MSLLLDKNHLFRVLIIIRKKLMAKVKNICNKIRREEYNVDRIGL